MTRRARLVARLQLLAECAIVTAGAVLISLEALIGALTRGPA